MQKLLPTVLLILLLSTRLLAWSTKEHVLLTRLAAEELIADPSTPEAMKHWLRRAAPDLRDRQDEKLFLLEQRVGIFPRGAAGVGFWATIPDMNAMLEKPGAEIKLEPFQAPEHLMHFIGLEFFMPDETKRTYAEDLSHKPGIESFPRDYHDARYQRAGMLPFRVEQCFGELVKSLREKRLSDEPGQYPRDEHAAKWAGFLAHYLEDNTQPHHATVDYKSASYFPNPLRAPNIHANMEYRLVDDDLDDYPELRKEFWNSLEQSLAELKDPAKSDDPWTATLEVALVSYDALPMIGRAGLAAYTDEKGQPTDRFNASAFFHFKGVYHAKQMTVLQLKAYQMAWAVKRVERVWRQAWDQATATAPIDLTTKTSDGVEN